MNVTEEMAERYSAGVNAYWKDRRSGRDGDAIMAGLQAALQSGTGVAVKAVAYASQEQIEALPADPADESGAAYIPLRHTPAGKFQMPLYPAPVQQAGVESELVEPVAWLIASNSGGNTWLQFTPDVAVADKPFVDVTPLYTIMPNNEGWKAYKAGYEHGSEAALKASDATLASGTPFAYDPATGFFHADDGGAPASAIAYVPKSEVEASDAKLAEAVTELKALDLAYVNLLESGRDRIIMLGGSCDPVDVMEQADPFLRRARSFTSSIQDRRND